MTSDDPQKYRKISVWLSKDDFLRFMPIAAFNGDWLPGYTQKGLRDAIWFYICYEEQFYEDTNDFIEIIKQKHPELKTRRKQVRCAVRLAFNSLK